MNQHFILSLCLILMLHVVNGQQVTDFTLQSATNDSEFVLSETDAEFVALHFLLKTECPICIRHTQSYLQNQDQLPEVVQVFIKPDTEAEIQAWAQNLSQEQLDQLPIYRDPGARLATEFGIPDGYQFHGQVVHYPALILLDQEGQEVFRYVGKNNRDRYSFEQLKAKLAELSK